MPNRVRGASTTACACSRSMLESAAALLQLFGLTSDSYPSWLAFFLRDLVLAITTVSTGSVVRACRPTVWDRPFRRRLAAQLLATRTRTSAHKQTTHDRCELDARRLLLTSRSEPGVAACRFCACACCGSGGGRSSSNPKCCSASNGPLPQRRLRMRQQPADRAVPHRIVLRVQLRHVAGAPCDPMAALRRWRLEQQRRHLAVRPRLNDYLFALLPAYKHRPPLKAARLCSCARALHAAAS